MNIRRLLIIPVLVSSFAGTPDFAEGGSPYEANGFGTIIPDNTGKSRSLGSAGIALGDGTNMMRGNPALLGTFTRHSYSVSMLYDRATMFMDGIDQPSYAKSKPNLLKFVIPFGRGIVASWGLSPYSRTDVTIGINPEPGNNYSDKVKTSGGINISTLGIAGSIKQKLYFGAALNYHFGTNEENWTRTFDSDSDLQGRTNYLKKKYKGYSTTFGILANPYKSMSVGFGYTTQTDLEMNVMVRSGNLLDPEIPFTGRNTKLPSVLRMGVSSQFGRRLTAVFDYSFEQWEDIAETAKEKLMYNNSYQFGGGLRFVPSTRINAPFYMKLPLSAGFKYRTLYYKSYPKIDTVSERAVTLGLEMPLKKRIGTLTSSLEYGVRGDKSKNGWDETYLSFELSLVGMIR